MEEKIEIGEYVRNESGVIHKVKSIDELADFFIDEEGKLKEIAGVDLWNEYVYEDIVNHSKNIKDLIEANDYVNGCRVEKIIGNTIIIFGINQGILEEDIRSIVTKEQFESIEYKVEG